MSKYHLGSASSLYRTIACPGWRFLEHAPDEPGEPAIRGTAIHDYLEKADQPGQLDKVDSKYREFCKRINLKEISGMYVPPEYREVKFAYDLETRTARVIPIEGHRNYGDKKWSEITGTADVVNLGFKSGEAYDYKTGRYDRKSNPVATNPQLLFPALCIKKTIGPHIENFTIGIQQILKTKINTWVEGVDMLQLQVFEVKLQRVWQVAQKIVKKVEQGEKPEVVKGNHCFYCPAKPNCPAWRNR